MTHEPCDLKEYSFMRITKKIERFEKIIEKDLRLYLKNYCEVEA